MSIKDKKIPLPWWVTSVFMYDGSHFVSPTGICSDMTMEKVSDETESNPYFSSIEGEDLVFYQIHSTQADGFYCKEHLRIHFNEYEEIECNWADVPEIPQRWDLMNGAYVYASRYISRLSCYKELCKHEIIVTQSNAIHVIRMFARKEHKLIEYLLHKGMYGYVKGMFNGVITNAYLLKKPVINICAKYGIDDAREVIDMISACSMHDVQMVDKFLAFARHFGQDIKQVINNLPNGGVDFTRFANYIVKSVFVTGQLRLPFGEPFALSNFMREYNDYDHMNISHRQGLDLFPENLKEAHAMAVESYNDLVHSGEGKDYMFKKAVSMYKNLSWENAEYGINVILPSCCNDLVDEGKVLHHCVKSYIDDVIRGRSMILLARKDDRPYMTLEIKNGFIMQAKKKFNNLPDAWDRKWLMEFSESKSIGIIGF